MNERKREANNIKNQTYTRSMAELTVSLPINQSIYLSIYLSQLTLDTVTECSFLGHTNNYYFPKTTPEKFSHIWLRKSVWVRGDPRLAASYTTDDPKYANLSSMFKDLHSAWLRKRNRVNHDGFVYLFKIRSKREKKMFEDIWLNLSDLNVIEYAT